MPGPDLKGCNFLAALTETRSLSKRLIAIWCGCAIVLAFAVLWTRAIPGESLIVALAQRDTRIQQHLWTIDISEVRHTIRFQLAIWSLLIALLATWWMAPERFRAYCRPRLFQWSMAAGCFCALYLLLVRAAGERDWYPIDILMTNPGSVPIFGQRLLFVWIADAVKSFHPSLSYVNAYYMSQIPAVLLTIWIVGRWSALFIGESLRWIGQLLVVVMLAMTFDYYTFYDVAVVFFYAAGLYLLKKRYYAMFVIVLAVGTLNHENISLLIVLALLETYRKPKLAASVCGAAVISYFAVRTLQQHLVPFDHHFDWRLWSNLYYPLFGPKIIAESAASLFFWWIAAATSWRYADDFLKRAALLFPMLLAVTYLFGQFQEPRQFDAFIPVVIGFILSRIGVALRLSPPPAGVSAQETASPRPQPVSL